MSTTIKTVSVNVDDWEFLIKERVNISAEVRDFLNQKVALMKGDSKGVDLELLKRKMKKKEEEHTTLTAELKEMHNIMELHKKEVEAKETKKIEEEKAKMEALSKCINCGNVIQGKKHNFKAGQVCQACFLGANGKQVSKWSKEAKNGETITKSKD